jgi:hypothetical protein
MIGNFSDTTLPWPPNSQVHNVGAPTAAAKQATGFWQILHAVGEYGFSELGKLMACYAENPAQICTADLHLRDGSAAPAPDQ